MNFADLQKRFFTSIVLLPILVFAILSNKFFFVSLLILVLFFSLYEWHNLNKNKFSTINIFGFIIIFLSIYFAYFLRGNDEKSAVFFLWIVGVCILSDIGGYFSGKFLGKKKITKISPNKTYAGVIGSLIFSTFSIFILYFFNYEFSLYHTLFLSLLLSLICQLGDITVSYCKRKNRIKDTSNLLPGHGGLLDRIDGIIFVILFMGILKLLKVI